jgi:hypothetical protein
MSSMPGGWTKPASDLEPASPQKLASPQDPAERKTFTRSRLRIFACAAILMALGLLGVREAFRIVDDPDTYFLLDERGATWIRADAPCFLGARPSAQTVTVFECRFTTAATVQNARLTVRAFRRFQVELDNKPLDIRPKGIEAAAGVTMPSRRRQYDALERRAREKANSPDAWKEPKEFVIPQSLAPGAHQLKISVFNFNAHPCVLAFSNELGIRTGADWFIVESNGKRTPAVRAAHARLPDEALLYPSVQEAFLSRWPWLAAAFVQVFAWTLWTSRPTRSAERSRWRLTPGGLRWILLAAWVVLAANNIWQIPNWVGPDLIPHLNYVFYIVEHRSLPLATDGFEMFQAPLFYLLAAPWYGLFAPNVSAIALVKILRFLPLVCGLAQIEIVYRTSRAVFPEKKDLQMLATTIGGLMPMNIYSSQVLGNEPLAGCLTGLLVLLCVSLIVEPRRNRSHWFFVVMGLVWGLAILSKVTPLLLAPLLIGVIAVHGRKVGGNWRQIVVRQTLVRVGLVFGTCFLTAGWWFLRNWARLGTPIATGLTRGNVWWQDPSYRTVPQLTSFGISLSRPIYGGVWSLWDTFYSSLWLDGNVSGLVIPPEVFHWNVSWMLAGAWLAAVPMALLCLSPAACLRRDLRPARDALLFSLAALAIYVAAIIDLYIGLPVLSTAKATYTIGLLPCYGLLAAAGAAPLLRGRFLRAVIISAIACWALAAYLAYFSTNYWLHGWEIGP